MLPATKTASTKRASKTKAAAAIAKAGNPNNVGLFFFIIFFLLSAMLSAFASWVFET
jgi:hypothetical protein